MFLLPKDNQITSEFVDFVYGELTRISSNQEKLVAKLDAIEKRQEIILDKLVETLATCQNIVQQPMTQNTGIVREENFMDINFQFDSESQIQEFNEKIGTDPEFKTQLVTSLYSLKTNL